MDIWIGLVGVSTLPGTGIVGGKKGAFAQVLAPASSVDTFQSAVSAALAELQLIAVEFEDIRPLVDGESVYARLDDDLRDLAEEARRTGEVCFGTFHSYPHADA